MKSTLLLFVVFLATSIVGVAQTQTIKIPLKFINETLSGIGRGFAELPFDKEQIVAKTPSNLSVRIERLPNSADKFTVTFDNNNDGNFSIDESNELNIGSKLSFAQQIKDKLGNVRVYEYELSFRRIEQKKYDSFSVRSIYSLKGEVKNKGCNIPIYLFDQNANSRFDDKDNASNIGLDKNNDGKIWGSDEWAYPEEIFELCGKNYLISNVAKDETSITLRRTTLQNVKLFGISPKFDFTLVNAKSLATNDLKGKPFLFDFWASWCGPCIAKIPEIKQIEGKLPVIYFNTDTIDRRQQALKLIKQLNILDRSVLRISPNADNFYKSYARLYRGLPYYVLIDADGRIRYAGNGGEDLKEIKTELKRLGIN